MPTRFFGCAIFYLALSFKKLDTSAFLDFLRLTSIEKAIKRV